MNVDLTVIIIILLGGATAIGGLFRPFLGLLVLMTLHFVQPGEMVPALAPLRIELVYALLLLIIVVSRNAAALKAILTTDPILRATLALEVVALITMPFAAWPGGAFATSAELSKLIMLQLLMTFFIDSQDRLRYILWLLVGFLMWFAGSSFSAYLQGQYYLVNGVQRAQGV